MLNHFISTIRNQFRGRGIMKNQSVRLGKKAFLGDWSRVNVESLVMGDHARIAPKGSQIHGGKITVGKHTYTGIIRIGAMGAEVSVGNYCSFADSVTIFTGFTYHHPEWVSTFPFGNVPTFDSIEWKSLSETDTEKAPLSIGHDVWIGQNTIILPSCKRIGNGAIVAAGSVVTKDVDDYAVIGGNPAALIKYRFYVKVIEALLELQWWNWPESKIQANKSFFTKDFRAVKDVSEDIAGIK